MVLTSTRLKNKTWLLLHLVSLGLIKCVLAIKEYNKPDHYYKKQNYFWAWKHTDGLSRVLHSLPIIKTYQIKNNIYMNTK